jgi:hypothetical protein
VVDVHVLLPLMRIPQGGEVAASSNICWNFSLALQSSLL